MEVTFSRSALADLEDIEAYYLEQDAAAVGVDFVASIFHHSETLQKNLP